METLYDVQQLFKQFGMYIYVGARIYDIELMIQSLLLHQRWSLRPTRLPLALLWSLYFCKK